MQPQIFRVFVASLVTLGLASSCGDSVFSGDTSAISEIGQGGGLDAAALPDGASPRDTSAPPDGVEDATTDSAADLGTPDGGDPPGEIVTDIQPEIFADIAADADADADPADAEPDAIADADAVADADALADADADALPDTATAPDVAPPPLSDPANPGALAAKVTKSWANPLFKGSLTGGKPLLCVPSADGGKTAAPGPFPLAILAPGFSIAAESYEPYCAHLATWGFIVVLRTYDSLFPDHSDEAAKTSALIDWLATPASGLADQIDFARIGTAGHSLGGKTSVYAAVLDPRIGAVVAWDPVDCGGPAFVGCPDNLVPDLIADLAAPLALLGETTDAEGTFISPACAPAGENYQAFYDASPVATRAVTIVGANHTSFTGTNQALDPCKKSTADVALVRSLTRRVTVAHFLAVLDGNTQALAWLEGPEMQSLVGLGLVTLQSK
ncbi:MAG: hypothetical protein R3F39_13380 [Myxococcota bacterium]